MNTRTLFLSLLAGVALAAASPAFPQAFPAKPVRIISPYPNGLTPDIAARAVADRLSRTWNQPVIVEPRPGANGFIAIGAAKKAAPDGHELLLAGQAHLSINPNIFPKAPYDAEQDFVPLSQIYRTPFFIAVAAAGPYKDVSDLIAAAKASQKKLSYSSPYVGSPPHLGAALFAHLIGAEMVHVPFKGVAQGLPEIVAGRLQLAFNTIPAFLPHVKAGRLKAFVISAPKRSPLLPEVPACTEVGLPGLDANAWHAVVAPAGTPKEIVRKLQQTLAATLALPEVRSQLAAVGAEPVASSPEDFAKFMRAESQKWARVIKAGGVKVE